MDDTFREVIVFHGREGEPCEGFIRAVRKAAFEAGKIRDDAWMADFASTCLDGPALRYYETLSPDVQGDWRLLRQALLVKYPPAEQVGGRGLAGNLRTFPTGAAASPPQPRKGRIKVIGENSTNFGYIGDGQVVTTSSIGAGASLSDALRISYTPSGKLCEFIIERQGGQNQTLGLHWRNPSPSTAIGSPNYAALTAFNYEGSHRSSSMSWPGPGYTLVWAVAPDNTVWPHLGDDNSCTALRFFKANSTQNGRSAIDAAADAGAFMTTWGAGWALVKLLFEDFS